MNVIVPIGSPAEANLLARTHAYLDRTYSFRRLEAMQNPDSTRAVGGKDWDAWVLARMLQLRDRGIAIERWLKANYSPAELDGLLERPYEQLVSSRDREAFMLLCELRDGSWISNLKSTKCAR